MRQVIHYTLLLILSAFFSGSLFAQYNLPENKTWIMGSYTGIDFTGSTPQLITTTNPAPPAASASVCDTLGHPLFYTDGSVIWNRNAQLMPNADSLGPAGFCNWGYTADNRDGGLIVGIPDSPGRYYVFSLTNNQIFFSTSGSGAPISPLYPGPSRLFYSEVDMTLDNGLGDVIPNRKWMPVDTGLSYKMTAVPGDNCNIWLIVHGSDTNMFKAYEITWKGLNPKPVISYTGIVFPPTGLPYWHPWDGGQLTISPDRKTLAAAYGTNIDGVAELYDFNPATGEVSNGWAIDSTGMWDDLWGITFSPDNSKLYTTHDCPPSNPIGFSSDIYQFDLSLGSHAAIRYSQILLSHNAAYAELRLAGDGKIYYGAATGFIEFPNVYGTGCHVNTLALTVPPNTQVANSMGNEFVKAIPDPHPDTTALTQLDTCVQIDRLEGFVLQAPQGDFIDYTWDDNTTNSVRTVTRPGTYWVTCIDRCLNMRIDTFSIKPVSFFTLGGDTSICAFPISLKTNVTDASYLWSTGNTTDSIQVFNSGTYWATVSKNGCSYTDSIQVAHLDVRQDLGKDLSLCKDDAVEINLNAQVPDGAHALWNTGSTTADIVARDTGIYWVTVTDQQCSGSDTLHITNTQCNCHFAAPTAFSPNGDGTNDLFHLVVERNCLVQGYNITIYNRWGQKVYTGNNLETGWDGTSNGQPQDIGTYSYIIEFNVGTKSNHYFQKGGSDIDTVRTAIEIGDGLTYIAKCYRYTNRGQRNILLWFKMYVSIKLL